MQAQKSLAVCGKRHIAPPPTPSVGNQAPPPGHTRPLHSRSFIPRTRGPEASGTKSSPVLPASYTPTVGCFWKICSQSRTRICC